MSCFLCGKPAKWEWNNRHDKMNVGIPPADLVGTKLCDVCYGLGGSLTRRIRYKRKTCSIPGCQNKAQYWWTVGDPEAKLPDPLPELKGVAICDSCYWCPDKTDFEELIRKGLGLIENNINQFPPIQMPNGQAGYICTGHCGEFHAYVEPQSFPYVCRSCKLEM